MKVGTDGVLLGAWCPVQECVHILDIGTGSGLIALMLAQRCPEAQIDAIDIDEASCEQARENFAASPWAERLHVTRSSLQDWSHSRLSTVDVRLSTDQYDLIVSNPPYFVRSLKAPDASRCAARHNDTLPYDALMADSTRLLKPDGRLALIVPCEAEDELQALAAEQGLQCIRRCYVHPKPERPAKLVMIAWQKSRGVSTEATEITERIVLENEHGGRSEAYQQLTKEFYL